MTVNNPVARVTAWSTRLYGAVMLLLFFCMWLGGCHTRTHTVTPAFYYWKTNYTVGEGERRALEGIKAGKLYLRLCDVGWAKATGRAEPHDVLRVVSPLPEGVEVIPVIFLEQQVLPQLTDSLLIDKLANNITVFSANLCSNVGIRPREFQLDCDWTGKSAAIYFALLRALKRQPFLQGKTLSVTIRLHQVKYVDRAGVPPADRGMLMCYNLGNSKNPNAENSILNEAEAEKYLDHLYAYPLRLDLALPIFRWCLWYRGGKLMGILRDADPDSCTRLPFLQAERGSTYTVKTETEWAGYPLRAGDRIRAESPDLETIKRVAHSAARQIPHDSLTVSFYHLDPRTLEKFPPRALEEILDRCR